MKWVKDQKVEHGLRKLNIRFETRQVLVKQIDLEESARRQVRAGKKIRDDWVLTYAEHMKAGDAFPMPILNEVGKERYFIWSGNHRVHAAILCDETIIDAYVVKVFDARIEDILPRIVNAWEALGTMTKEERYLNAKYFVDHHSMMPADACKMLGLNYATFSQFLRGESISEELRSAGVNGSGKLSMTIRKSMGVLADNKKVLKETAEFLIRNNIVGDEAMQVIRDVKQGENELQKMAVLARWDQILTKREAKPSTAVLYRTPIRDKAIKTFSSLAKLLEEYDDLERLQLVDPDDLKTVYSFWRTISARMDRLQKKGGK